MNRQTKVLLVFTILFLISSCATNKTKEEAVIGSNSPDDLYSEIELSSSNFSGMSARGTIAIEGNDKMSLDISAMLGIKVLRAYLHEDKAKAAIFYSNTNLEQDNIYNDLEEKLRLSFSRELLLSLFKGSVPTLTGDMITKEARADGELYSHVLNTGAEYFLLDSQKRLKQYQQKNSDNSATITFLFSDYSVIEGYAIPQRIDFKIPQLEIDATLKYINPRLMIPSNYKFDFELPASGERKRI